MPRPTASECPAYFDRYTSLVKADSAAEAVAHHSAELDKFYLSLPEEKAGYAYAADKWTIKDVLQHVIDAERIFAYRLMRIARKDQTPLPSFDENTYAETALAGKRTLLSLKEEFSAVRKSTDLLINSLSEEQLACVGYANHLATTANAFAFITFGHLLHHQQILQERYL